MNSTQKTFVLGCAVASSILFFGSLSVIVVFMISLQKGYIPATGALPLGKIPPRQIAQLVDMGVIEPEEEVHYFYSAGMFSIREDGNLFADRRVISYQELDGQLDVYEANYNDIASIQFTPSSSTFEDSTITINLTNGDWFILYVSPESNGDDTFYERIHERWQKRVKVPTACPDHEHH